MARVPIVSFPFVLYNISFCAKSLFDELCPCCSVESSEDLQPLVANDRRLVMEPGAPNAKQGQAGADSVAPIMEQSATIDPVGPTVEEPLVAWPTSPEG